MPIALFDLPHVAARRLLATGVPVVLCVDPVEYHGPHLSLHNDRLLSLGVTRELAVRWQLRHDWPLVLADHLELGVEPCPGPGTRAFPFAAVRDAVLASVRALHALGAQRVVLMTFHGAPLHNLALEAGVQWLRAHGVAAIAPFHLVLQRLVDPSGLGELDDALASIDDPRERAELAAALPHDFHAGFFETSLALHWAPHTVAEIHRALPPCPAIMPDATLTRAAALARRLGRAGLARELELAAHARGWSALRPFPAYTSQPALANPRAGACFAARIVELYDGIVDDVLHGRADPPSPIVRWSAPLAHLGQLVQSPELGQGDVLAPPKDTPNVRAASEG